MLNANEYSRVRWAFAPNGIAVNRHRSHSAFVVLIDFISNYFGLTLQIYTFFLRMGTPKRVKNIHPLKFSMEREFRKDNR